LFSTVTEKEVFVLILTNGGESTDSLMGDMSGKDMTVNEGMSPEEGEVARVEASGHTIHTFLYKVTTLQDHLRVSHTRVRLWVVVAAAVVFVGCSLPPTHTHTGFNPIAFSAPAGTGSPASEDGKGQFAQGQLAFRDQLCCDYCSWLFANCGNQAVLWG
jgi:hypothetical protein